MSWSMCATIFIIIAPIIYEGIDLKNAIKEMKTVYPSNERPLNGSKENCKGRLSTGEKNGRHSSGEKTKNIKVGSPMKDNFADPMFINQSRVSEEV